MLKEQLNDAKVRPARFIKEDNAMNFNEAATLILLTVGGLFALSMLLVAAVTVIRTRTEEEVRRLRSIMVQPPRSTTYGGVKGTLMPIVSIPPFGESSDPKARVWWDG
jgi:hypothetical protein